MIAVEQAVAAPFATRQLADLGARVIKIERPEGDFARTYDEAVRGMSSYFVWLNRGKESVVLDLRNDESRRVLDALIAKADVFVQNLAPGAAQRLGLGSEELRAHRPDLITCDISGYGIGGPFEDRKAYDLLVQCEAGLVSITGTPNDSVRVGISIADIAAGMYAYTGILTALYNRRATGTGAALQVSLFDSLAEWMGNPSYYARYSGSLPVRSGANHPSIAPYGPQSCSDGRSVFIGVQNEREWHLFCDQVIRRPDIGKDPRFGSNSSRVANRDDLDRTIAGVFVKLTSEQVTRRLEVAGIANGRMNTVAEFLEHPQLTQRDRWRDVGSPVGKIRALMPPVVMGGFEPLMGDVPALGQHTAMVVAEFAPGADQGHKGQGQE